jgi:uncharacterized protein (TIGR02594 family)
MSNVHPLIRASERYLGTAEIPGARHSPTIMGWVRNFVAKRGKWVGNIFHSDEVPWCGLFIAQVVEDAGYRAVAAFPSADKWREWGDPVPNGVNGARVGDIGVISRPGGNHVFIMLAVSPDASRVLARGGNQSNRVGDDWLQVAGRRLTVRRAPGMGSLFPLLPARNPGPGGKEATTA